jgi:peptidoglycan/LPS O-acetylase OafA/YrhL
MQKTEILSFTGLRGLAAIYVMAYHYQFFQGADSVIRRFMQHGYLAVDIFFVLSGFVMAMTYGKMFSNGFEFENYKTFIKKRLARVYPVYFVSSVLVVVAYDMFEVLKPDIVLNFKDVLSQIFLIQAWGISKSYMGAAWSISTEWAAYLIFPILMSLLVFRGWSSTILYTAMAYIMIVILYFGLLGNVILTPSFGPLDYSNGVSFGPLLRCIPEFALGLFAYKLSQNSRAMTIIQHDIVSTLLAFSMVRLLFIWGADLAFVMLLPFFVASLSSDKTIVARVISLKPFYLLGVISYSLYMVHVIPLWPQSIIQHEFESLGIPHAFTATIALCALSALALATVTYYAIEKPSRKYFQVKFK